MSQAATAYRTLPADERQEFRLPSLLKEHLNRAAARAGQSVTEYITTALAEKVSDDLETVTEWTLTGEEQATLLKLLAEAPEPSARARRIAERADELFGPLT